MNLVRAAGFVGVVVLWSAAPAGAQCGVNMTCNPSDTPAGSATTDAAASAPSGGPSFGQCGVNMTCNPSDAPAAVRPAPNFFATPDGSGSSAPNFVSAHARPCSTVDASRVRHHPVRSVESRVGGRWQFIQR